MSQLIFKKYGGSYQLRIQNAEDMEKIQDLDAVYWAATSIPIDSLNCDKAFTGYVDTDNNGRIRPAEIKDAWTWLTRVLANRHRLAEATEVLRLQDIDTQCAEGQKLRATAELILDNLKMSATDEISLSQIRDVRSIMSNAASNGDGIIPPEATNDADLAQFIKVIMDTAGSRIDASGKPGIGEKELELFVQEAKSFLAWKAQGEIPHGQEFSDIMPWANETGAAQELVKNIEGKIDQFFAQCYLVKFDKRAANEMLLREQELKEIDFSDTSELLDRMKQSPLAVPNAAGILDLDGEINPLYEEALHQLKVEVLHRALGKTLKQLHQNDWRKVKSIFHVHRQWLENKQGGMVDKLGQETLRSYLDGPYQEQAIELVKKDLAVANDLNQIQNLEKLILFQRWLMVLANNFVSFADLYNPHTRALFEVGTLVIDERLITFVMGVGDRAAHKKISQNSMMYLLYAKVTGREDKDISFEIVAPVTSGNSDGLTVGKRGIFFTVDGREWDAEIVDILDNPISVWESVKAPFKKISQFIQKQVEKTAKSSEEKLVSVASAPSTSGSARDLMLGGGIAIAALGSSFAYITKALSEVQPLQILIAVLGLAMVVLLPGIFSGFLKIRRRDISGLLEASGWAVNVRMRVSHTMGLLFTHKPELPKNARREHRDTLRKFVREIGAKTSESLRATTLLLLSVLILLCLAVLTKHLWV